MSKNIGTYNYASSALLLLIFLFAALPNSIESAIFVNDIFGQQHPLILYVAIAVCAALSIWQKILISDLLLFCFFTLIFGISYLLSKNYEQPNTIFALFNYATPLLSILIFKKIQGSPRYLKLYYYSIFFLLVSQGAFLLFSSAAESISYLSPDSSHRDSFGHYRYGSTLAAANTSGCLVALAIPPLMKYAESNAFRMVVFLSAALAIIGYQSRAGMLIYALIAIFFLPKSKTKSLIVLALLLTALLAIILLRSGDDQSSSNLYRLYLAKEAYNLYINSDVYQFLFGFGPGSGVSRDLSSYYGQNNNLQKTLLTSSESFVVTSFIENGVVGAMLWPCLIKRFLGSNSIALAFFIFLLLDPSFYRTFESFVTLSFMIGSGWARNSYSSDHKVHQMKVKTTENNTHVTL